MLSFQCVSPPHSPSPPQPHFEAIESPPGALRSSGHCIQAHFEATLERAGQASSPPPAAQALQTAPAWRAYPTPARQTCADISYLPPLPRRQQLTGCRARQQHLVSDARPAKPRQHPQSPCARSTRMMHAMSAWPRIARCMKTSIPPIPPTPARGSLSLSPPPAQASASA